MTVHRTQMESWGSNGEEIGPWDCEVRITDDIIVVSYEEDGENIVYQGREIAPGCYSLRCPSMEGSATLYRGVSGLLEGTWIEEGYEGTWRIPLSG